MLHSTSDIVIPAGGKQLGAFWTVPAAAQGTIVFVHGSGSSRYSPRNQEVAQALQQARFATLLMDLLEEEEANDRANVFDIGLLAERVVQVLDWLTAQPALARLPIGLFGASTGAAAALRAAALRPGIVKAVVSRGGRPDLAWHDLPKVKAPTLLLVGGEDFEVLQLNRSALRRLRGTCELQIIPGATHLFEEPGALQKVAALARQWFSKCMVQDADDDVPLIGFANRAEAGHRLAERLQGRALTDPLILGIPRGGIVLGAILADELNAELDVVLARKLRMPGNPEFALGAISEHGERYLNIPLEEMAPPLRAYLEQESQHQLDEIARRRELFRHGRPAASVNGRSVIVTDDGIATGSTMIAALRSVRGQNPQELIVAVPVASADRLRDVRKECDDTVCLIEAPHLFAVGQFYQDFTQVADAAVVSLLSRYAR